MIKKIIIIILFLSSIIFADTTPQNLINLDLDNIAVKDFVLKVSELLNRNYILPENLRGKVSISSPEKINIEKLPDILESILNIKGYASVKSDSFYKILTLNKAFELPVDIESNVAIKTFNLKNISASIVISNLKRIIPSYFRILSLYNTNDIIVIGYKKYFKTIERIIKLLDDKKNTIKIVKLKNGNYKVILRKISSIIQIYSKANPIFSNLRYIAFEPVNGILLAGQPKAINEVNKLIKILDVADSNLNYIKVYYPEYINIKGLSGTISKILSSNRYKNEDINSSQIIENNEYNFLTIVTSNKNILKYILDYLKIIDKPIKSKNSIVKVVPLVYADETELIKIVKDILKNRDASKLKKTYITADKRLHSIIISSIYPSLLTEIENIISTLDKESNVKKSGIHIYKLQYATAKNVADVLNKLDYDFNFSADDKKNNRNTRRVYYRGRNAPPEKVKITYDESTNSIVVVSSPYQFAQIKPVIKKFDIPKPQVLINVMIAEVSADLTKKIGVEWQVGGRIKGSYQGGVSQYFGMVDAATLSDKGAREAAKTVPGFSVGLINGDNTDIGAIINLFKQDSNFNILSTPQILTEDNNKATINVGQKVPFITNSRVTDNNATIYSYEYQDVGIILKITPHINKSNQITMDIEQSVKNLLEKVVFDAPLVSTREIQTRVTVDNKKMIIIGGLISKQNNETVYKVPILSKIPLLGELFKRKENHTTKTNLLVIINPIIININSESTVKLKGKLKETYKNQLKELNQNLPVIK